jgi:putative transposase
MDEGRYLWRQLSDRQRKELLEWRQQQGRPWHSPPHRASEHFHYHVTAACHEHRAHIGLSLERMEAFSRDLLAVSKNDAQEYVVVWCVMPNHYHLLLATANILEFLARLGKLHGRTSFTWNGEERTRGRKVRFNAVERALRSERHYWATVNYVHHNPVHHRYVKKWEDWPFSSARDYLRAVGRQKALETWWNYPVLDYGKGWDDPEM